MSDVHPMVLARALVAWGRTLRLAFGLTPKCDIQWIDRQGNPTPDNEDAIGVAVCHRRDPDGKRYVGAPLAICSHHAKQAGAFFTHLGNSIWHVEPHFSGYVPPNDDSQRWSDE